MPNPLPNLYGKAQGKAALVALREDTTPHKDVCFGIVTERRCIHLLKKIKEIRDGIFEK